MKMRYVIVPNNAEAANRLEYNLAAPEELIQIVLTENDFYRLEKSGFFSFLNNLVDANIDDYEDEVIQGRDNIQKVLTFIHDFNIGRQQKVLVNDIERLFTEALLRNTGVYFYF